MDTKNLYALVTASPKSQNAIAQDLGMSQQRLNNYINGQREPDFETAIKIADYFHVSLDYLAGKEEPGSDKEAEFNAQEQKLIRIARKLDPPRQELLLRLAAVVAAKDSPSIP